MKPTRFAWDKMVDVLQEFNANFNFRPGGVKNKLLQWILKVKDIISATTKQTQNFDSASFANYLQKSWNLQNSSPSPLPLFHNTHIIFQLKHNAQKMLQQKFLGKQQHTHWRTILIKRVSCTFNNYWYSESGCD